MPSSWLPPIPRFHTAGRYKGVKYFLRSTSWLYKFDDMAYTLTYSFVSGERHADSG